MFRKLFAFLLFLIPRALLERARATSINRQTRGQVDLPGVAIILVISGVVAFVGIQVMSTVVTTTGLSQGDAFYNASQSLQTAIDNAWGLFGVGFIVLILSVVIIYMYGLRGR
jgi:hypothetical protein